MTDAPVDWDDAAARSAWGHTMQSSAWAKIRDAQGWRPEFIRFGEALPLALVLWRDVAPGFPIGYVPRGPIIKPHDQRDLRVALLGIARVAKERSAIFVKVDPELDPAFAEPALREGGFRRASDIQPVLSTLHLDLAPDEDALMAALEKDTRWSVRQAPKRGVILREAHDDTALRAFYDLYIETGGRAGFITRTWPYYRNTWRTLIDAELASLRLAYVEEVPVAGAMVWRCGDRALYQTGATNDAGRKSYAAYALLWECIIEAKRQGRTTFDMGGIPVDLERKDDPMYGPYQFKRGFGGVVQHWVGAHDTVPSPLLYRSYTVAEPIYTKALQLVGRLRR
ncbi:MAG TPA: peptidoglycan bridge formation glycyltransferase FemA/FemB family protein [Candidatus Limnocylindrales bacterium]|nr:peptidoglycan bridge formation glycyltransferase FemA/FemB family protein [Candidatus Limnocylindrales bacterium]